MSSSTTRQAGSPDQGPIARAASETLPLLQRLSGRRASTARGDTNPYSRQSELPQGRRLSTSYIHQHSGHGLQFHPQPLIQRLFASQYLVLNPSSSFDPSASSPALSEPPYDPDFGGDYFDQSRASILSVFRPERLIGKFESLAHWSDHLVATDSVKKSLRLYYENQNDLIKRYAEIDHFLDYGKMHLNMLSTYSGAKSSDEEDDESAQPPVAEDMQVTGSKSRFNEVPGNIKEGGQFLGFDEEQSSYNVHLAIMVNFFINFLLLVGKVVISLMTNSLSVVASLVDSVLDFLSTFIIFIANRLSSTNNYDTQIAYPIGRAKLEPLGILIFSVIIIISFIQVGLESTKKLLNPSDTIPVQIGLQAGGVMLITILAKVGCWWWCSKSPSSSVQALAQDAVTDIVFNSISLIMPTAGHFFGIWWFDPAGALLLSVYVILSWSRTAFEHIDNLTGAVADKQDYKVILYLAYRFAECIKQITALKVYHAGDKLNVEIDIVFDTENFDLGFRDAHDIAEALQYAIETLPMVERAFVHIDYMEGNYKGHLK